MEEVKPLVTCNRTLVLSNDSDGEMILRGEVGHMQGYGKTNCSNAPEQRMAVPGDVSSRLEKRVNVWQRFSR